MASGMVLAISALALFTTVYSHGMLCTPRQRGAYHSTKCGSNLKIPRNPVTDHCAHCLNGGTVRKVSQHLPRSGWAVYDPLKHPETGRRAGLCGDPFGDKSHMIGGRYMPYTKTPIVAHWKTGSVVNLEVEIDTNHNGYFEFFLCNLDSCKSKDISGKCMTDGHCYRLQRAAHPDCQNPSRKTHSECGPIDKRYPGRWYVPCRKTGHVGVHLVGGARGTMKYYLPKRLTCNHCVLQWYWATGNSCAPRGFLNYFKNYNNPFGTTCDSDGGGKGGYRPGMGTCQNRVVPEEFWSCADVRISNSGSQSAFMEMEKDRSQTSGNRGTQAPPKSMGTPKKKESPKSTQKGFNMSKKKTNLNPSRGSKPNPMKPGRGNLNGQGRCAKLNQTCGKNIRCCEEDMACAHTQQNGFVCKVWYNLWKDAQDQNEGASSPYPKNTDNSPAAFNGNKKKQEMCIDMNTECDGTIPCCGKEMVCVRTPRRKFVCRFWYNLWRGTPRQP